MTPATTTAERPVFFPAADETLFGIHTAPAGEPRGVGVVIIQGGDTVNVALMRNRASTRLARTLSGLGFDVLRFDYHGLGESTGLVEELHLDRPFEADVVAAADWMRAAGLQHFVLAGACFGARSALTAAPLVPGVVGVMAVTPPVAGYARSDASAERMARDRSLGDYARRALRPATLRRLRHAQFRKTYLRLASSKLRSLGRRLLGGPGSDLSWVSNRFLDPLEWLAGEGVPTLVVYGQADPLLREFERARRGRLGAILEQGAGVLELHTDTPGVVHGLVTVDVQEAFLGLAVDWISRVTAPGAHQPPKNATS